MAKAVWLSLLCLNMLLSFAHASTAGVMYYNKIFGHVHKTASQFSSSLTTITCGHPVKVSDKDAENSLWLKVKVADTAGFIDQKHLSESRPECFQAKYPKFFNSIDLDLDELYFWGRLYDQFIEGESRFK